LLRVEEAVEPLALAPELGREVAEGQSTSGSKVGVTEEYEPPREVGVEAEGAEPRRGEAGEEQGLPAGPDLDERARRGAGGREPGRGPVARQADLGAEAGGERAEVGLGRIAEEGPPPAGGAARVRPVVEGGPVRQERREPVELGERLLPRGRLQRPVPRDVRGVREEGAGPSRGHIRLDARLPGRPRGRYDAAGGVDDDGTADPAGAGERPRREVREVEAGDEHEGRPGGTTR